MITLIKRITLIDVITLIKKIAPVKNDYIVRIRRMIIVAKMINTNSVNHNFLRLFGIETRKTRSQKIAMPASAPVAVNSLDDDFDFSGKRYHKQALKNRAPSMLNGVNLIFISVFCLFY